MRPLTRTTHLNNGVVVATQQVAGVRSASLGVYLDVGSRDETPDSNGIAHLYEHMVFKGTEYHTGLEIAKAFESSGGQVNAFTSKEQTCFFAKVVDTEAIQALRYLLEMTLSPVFDAAELEKEREVIIEEIKGSEDTPDDHIYDLFSEAYYGKHPLGFPISGTTTSVAGFQLRHLRAHQRKTLNRFPYFVIAAGNVEHGAIVAEVRSQFASIPKTPQPKRGVLRRGTVRPKPSHLKLHREIHQANVMLGGPGYATHHPKRHALMMLNSVLGDGMSSRLFQHVREDCGLVYHIYSNPEFWVNNGLFTIGFATEPQHLAQAMELICRDFQDLKTNGLTQDELQFACQNLEGSILLGLESTQTRMGYLARQVMYGSKTDSLDHFIRKLKQVTLEEIQTVIDEIFIPQKWASAMILPKGSRFDMAKSLRF